MFLRGVINAAAGGDTATSFDDEFLDIQANGLVNFRVGGRGCVAPMGTGGVTELMVADLGAVSVVEGDQGIAGRELAMLLRDSFFLGCFTGSAAMTSDATTVKS